MPAPLMWTLGVDPGVSWDKWCAKTRITNFSNKAHFTLSFLQGELRGKQLGRTGFSDILAFSNSSSRTLIIVSSSLWVQPHNLSSTWETRTGWWLNNGMLNPFGQWNSIHGSEIFILHSTVKNQSSGLIWILTESFVKVCACFRMAI